MRNFFRFHNEAEKPDTAHRLYEKIAKLPIYDYHCHLSPKEIWEDAPIDNIGALWLGHDHYKWRLMRQFGIDEHYITGDASWEEKFCKYAMAVSLAAGNPLYHWTKMELEMYFGITEELTADNAKDIFRRANDVIAAKALSPRKLIELSGVRYIATTDDIIDTLEYHQKLAAQATLCATVAPSFRTDNLLQVNRPDYLTYLERLSAVSGVAVTDLETLKQAVCSRLDYFCQNGCKFTDVGIEYFPRIVGSAEEAQEAFERVLAGETLSAIDYSLFLGHMFVFLGCEYAKRNLVMQIHLAVKRNANSMLYQALGADAGGDCMGDAIPGDAIIAVLDQINTATGLPRTILYSMNASMCTQLATIAGSFPRVNVGTAWWMCDHKRGIAEQIRVIAEVGHLATFYGMLTDSRSFTSYARHDYFRRILCDVMAEWVDKDGFPEETALVLLERICFLNTKNLIEQ